MFAEDERARAPRSGHCAGAACSDLESVHNARAESFSRLIIFVIFLIEKMTVNYLIQTLLLASAVRSGCTIRRNGIHCDLSIGLNTQAFVRNFFFGYPQIDFCAAADYVFNKNNNDSNSCLFIVMSN